MASVKHKRAAIRDKTIPAEAQVDPVRTATIRAADRSIIREPTAVRDEWLDPDDLDRSTRVPKKVVGFRRADTLLTLQKRSDGKISKRHVDAADLFRSDYQIGVEGARPGRGRDLVPSVLPSGFTSGDYEPHHRRLPPRHARHRSSTWRRRAVRGMAMLTRPRTSGASAR